MKKTYFDYNSIHTTVAKLATRILASDFETDIIIAIGSGGFIPARILRTYIYKPILTVGVSYYDGKQKKGGALSKIQWIDEAEKKIAGKRVLLIDEVDDSRATLLYCVKELLRYKPKELAVCVLHQKNKTKVGPFPTAINHVFVGEQLEDLWLCYPWDAVDIEQHNALTEEQVY